MADDLGVTPGTGATVRMVEKSSKKHQVVVLDLGGAGAEALLVLGQALMAASLPVVLASDHGDIKVTLDGEAPTVNLGATDNAVLDAIVAALPAALGAGGGLKVDGSGTALPVSGTVTANLSATDNAVLDAIAAGVKDSGPAQTITRTYTTNADFSTAREITAAPTAGQKIVATDLLVSTDTDCLLTIQMETSNNVLAGVYVYARTPIQISLRGFIKADAADKKLLMKSSVASAGTCTAVYFSEA